jgi:rod shape determining protein RodA
MVFMGWVNIYAAVYNEEHHSILDITQRYGKQLIWIGAALGLAFIILIIDSRFYSIFAYPIYGVMIFMLIAVLIFGREIHGAKSWFVLGSFQFQPAELAKLATALALSRYVSSYNVKLDSFNPVMKVAGIIFLPAALIVLQHDTGSALVYIALILPLFREGLPGAVLVIGLLAITLFILSLVVSKLFIISGLILVGFLLFMFIARSVKKGVTGMFIFLAILGAGFALKHFFSLGISIYLLIILSLALASVFYLAHAYLSKTRIIPVLLLVLAGAIAVTYSVNYVFYQVLKEHQQHRINVLLGIESDPLGIGYNVNQSKIAIGSGGLTGKGFLQGTQTKFDFVPEQSTDFIFCTVGEEWGFMGSFVIIVLFVILLVRLLALAERQRSQFSRIFGYSVLSIFFFHIAVNIGMTIGLLPVIGIPLPFFSYGGSSLWAFTMMLFIFLRLDASRLEILR